MSIKIITEPSIYLVGRQQIDGEGLGRFLEAEGVPDWSTDTEVAGQALVEVAGRLCYKSYAKPRPGGNAAYIKHILEVGHGSVLEHAVFNVIITGVSRSFTHELVRHRAGFGYSQLSQRFVDESECSFVMPQPIAADPYLRDLFVETAERCQDAYGEMSDILYARFSNIPDKTLRRKKAREAARSVLPNCTETQIFVTGNARAFRHFIEMRGDAAADAEIRRVAVALLQILAVEAPNLFGDYVLVPDNDGSVSVTTEHRKV